jgi:hypothetical protein
VREVNWNQVGYNPRNTSRLTSVLFTCPGPTFGIFFLDSLQCLGLLTHLKVLFQHRDARLKHLRPLIGRKTLISTYPTNYKQRFLLLTHILIIQKQNNTPNIHLLVLLLLFLFPSSSHLRTGLQDTENAHSNETTTCRRFNKQTCTTNMRTSNATKERMPRNRGSFV